MQRLCKELSRNQYPLYEDTRVRCCVLRHADEWLQQMDQEGRQRFQPFCNTMKINYMKLAMQNLPQKVIFDNLAEWLHANTNQDETMHLEQ